MYALGDKGGGVQLVYQGARVAWRGGLFFAGRRDKGVVCFFSIFWHGWKCMCVYVCVYADTDNTPIRQIHNSSWVHPLQKWPLRTSIFKSLKTDIFCPAFGFYSQICTTDDGGHGVYSIKNSIFAIFRASPTQMYLQRFSSSDFFGASRCLVSTPEFTSSTSSGERG